MCAGYSGKNRRYFYLEDGGSKFLLGVGKISKALERK
jgi:hypothetical protein